MTHSAETQDTKRRTVCAHTPHTNNVFVYELCNEKILRNSSQI